MKGTTRKILWVAISVIVFPLWLIGFGVMMCFDILETSYQNAKKGEPK